MVTPWVRIMRVLPSCFTPTTPTHPRTQLIRCAFVRGAPYVTVPSLDRSDTLGIPGGAHGIDGMTAWIPMDAMQVSLSAVQEVAPLRCHQQCSDSSLAAH